MECKTYYTKTGKPIRLWHGDCMDLMDGKPENYWDLAICDPPYGIGRDSTQGFAKKQTKGFTFTKKIYKNGNWDLYQPNKEYFKSVFKISYNQIIWGANYFINKLPEMDNFIFWYKKGLSKDDKFNEGEIAYTSKGRTRMVDIWWNGFGTINSGENRFHPTQKPIKLYRWLLQNYAEECNTILDTHGGSMSLAIACYIEDHELDIIELDEDYYKEAVQRFENHISQKTLF